MGGLDLVGFEVGGVSVGLVLVAGGVCVVVGADVVGAGVDVSVGGADVVGSGGGPVETVIVTVAPAGCLDPPEGS